MGVKSIPLKIFKEFLRQVGCHHVRSKGGHEVWNKKDGSLLRPIIIQSHFNEVPITHIHTNLRTLGISHAEFERIIKDLK